MWKQLSCKWLASLKFHANFNSNTRFISFICITVKRKMLWKYITIQHKTPTRSGKQLNSLTWNCSHSWSNAAVHATNRVAHTEHYCHICECTESSQQTEALASVPSLYQLLIEKVTWKVLICQRCRDQSNKKHMIIRLKIELMDGRIYYAEKNVSNVSGFATYVAPV